TKHREATITPEIRDRLYDYIGGIIRGERGVLYAIGGMPEHVHLLVRRRPDVSDSILLRNLKSHSSLWVHQTFPAMEGFAWQEGYGAFSVSRSMKETVERYIANQEEHHRRRSFKEEFVEMLKAHDIEFDERYIWE